MRLIKEEELGLTFGTLLVHIQPFIEVNSPTQRIYFVGNLSVFVHSFTDNKFQKQGAVDITALTPYNQGGLDCANFLASLNELSAGNQTQTNQ